MKKEFSTAWRSSSQVRKQRKYLANAPLHIKREFISAHLSKSLKGKYGTRSVTLRKGDEVKVVRGKFKKKMGKITEIDLKNSRVTIDGIQSKKKDGTKVSVYFNASNLEVQTLADDKRRFKRAKVKTSEKKEAKKPEVKKETKKEEKKEAKK